MRLRESGMPEEKYWESLFDVNLILDRIGIDSTVCDVAELGCGYGTFTVPVAQLIRGVIETYDIEQTMVDRTLQRARESGLSNVRAEQRDVLAGGFGGEPQSKDACLLFNILHGEEPERLLAHAARVLHPDGRVLVIHWCFDPATPRGPSMGIRPRPGQIIEWARSTEVLQLVTPILDLPPWHYGLCFVRMQVRPR
jgi:SAM-dependent methyltransferase